MSLILQYGRKEIELADLTELTPEMNGLVYDDRKVVGEVENGVFIPKQNALNCGSAVEASDWVVY